MNTDTIAPATTAPERAEADTVSFTVAEQIAWVKFNRPEKRNCMSPKFNRQMMRVLDELEFRADVGVLVLSGEGDAWSAGMDLKEYFRETEKQGLGAVRGAQREAYGWWRRLRWYQKPTIAMVNGWCFGGGYGPLFACDLAFAAEEAQFGLSEINWGILPGGGATKVARELLSFRRAMYHSLMGENIDGKTAAEWGLVNEALPLAQAQGSRGSGGAHVAEEKSGRAQGHERRHSARRRNDLRQCGGLSGARSGGRQLVSIMKGARKASSNSSTTKVSSPVSPLTTDRSKATRGHDRRSAGCFERSKHRAIAPTAFGRSGRALPRHPARWALRSSRI